MTKTQAERDAYLASLYIARTEGKTIQYPGNKYLGKPKPVWFDLGHTDYINYHCRIKVQTVEEVAKEDYNLTRPFASHLDAYQAGASFGAEWQKDQGNE